jgi:hypothetical protein
MINKPDDEDALNGPMALDDRPIAEEWLPEHAQEQDCVAVHVPADVQKHLDDFCDADMAAHGCEPVEAKQPIKKIGPNDPSLKQTLENLPPDCISKRLAHGFVDMSTTNIESSIYKRVQDVYNDDGLLPLQMLGNREELADSAWWLNRVDGIADALNARFPWMETITERICNHLLFCGRFQTPIHIPPMLLVGQHGIGKTSYLNHLAELLQIRVQFVDVSGVSAGWVLTGSDSTWNRGKQGLILETILDFHEYTGDAMPLGNPIIVLDEIDKESTESRFPLNTVLLPMLEKATAKRFSDECVRGMTWDISYMSFFATANGLQGISDPLLSRFQVMQITPPTEQQKFDAVLRMVDEYDGKICKEMQIGPDVAFRFRLEDEGIAREIAKMESLRDIAWRLDDAVRRAVARDPLAEVFTLKPGDFDLAPQKRSFGFFGGRA